MSTKSWAGALGVGIAVALLAPVNPASATTVSVARTGNSSHMNFSWASSHSWNSGTIYLTDTAADSHAIHTNIWDDISSSYEGRRDNNAGYNQTASYSTLSFNSSNYNLRVLHLEGCVNMTLGDACSNGAGVTNPYA